MTYPMPILIALEEPGNIAQDWLPDPGEHWQYARKVMDETGQKTVRIVYWDALAKQYRAKTYTRTGHDQYTIDFEILKETNR